MRGGGGSGELLLLRKETLLCSQLSGGKLYNEKKNHFPVGVGEGEGRTTTGKKLLSDHLHMLSGIFFLVCVHIQKRSFLITYEKALFPLHGNPEGSVRVNIR